MPIAETPSVGLLVFFNLSPILGPPVDYRNVPLGGDKGSHWDPGHCPCKRFYNLLMHSHVASQNNC